MTIAEKLYITDIQTLIDIAVIYQLDWITKLYIPALTEIIEDDTTYERLMLPSAYSGKVERRHGAITQPHRLVVK